VLEMAAFNKAEPPKYCRNRRLYPAQTTAWREAYDQANGSACKLVVSWPNDQRKVNQQFEKGINPQKLVSLNTSGETNKTISSGSN
jgi:hypothetical protein